MGELSFLDETPHYASLVAVGATRVFGIEREKLESLLARASQIVYRVMRAIVRTVHEIQRRISMQTTRAHELHLQAAREVLTGRAAPRASR